MNVQEGAEITLEGIGLCRVVQVFPSGSAKVRDYDDRLWLVARDAFFAAQTSLFSFQEIES